MEIKRNGHYEKSNLKLVTDQCTKMKEKMFETLLRLPAVIKPNS